MITKKHLLILATAALVAAVLGWRMLRVGARFPATGWVGVPVPIEIVDQDERGGGVAPPNQEATGMPVTPSIPLAFKGEEFMPIDVSVFVDAAYLSRLPVVPSPQPFSGRPVAGIVNHHLLADDLIIRLFKSLKASRPDIERFIILSPDHRLAGSTGISTTRRDYRLEGKTVQTDQGFVDSLVERGLATEENGEMFAREHGIGVLIPALSHEFPDAKIVPIALRASSDRKAAEALGKFLATQDDGKAFVLVSADMSHYLSESRALKNDETTLRWITEGNAAAISSANDDYLDNRKGFVSAFAFLRDRAGEGRFQALDRGISTEFGGDPKNTTGYITGFWMEE